MAVTALVGSVVATLEFVYRATDFLALLVPHRNTVGGNFGNIAFFQENEAVGNLLQGHGIGGNKVFLDADADDQRAAGAGTYQALRLFRTHHAEGIGTVEFLGGGGNGLQQVTAFLEQVVNQVHHDFGVGFRQKLVALGDQLFAQFLVIFDDAIVHQRDVAGCVGMGVFVGGHAVGSPAGMGNAQLTRGGVAVE